MQAISAPYTLLSSLLPEYSSEKVIRSLQSLTSGNVLAKNLNMTPFLNSLDLYDCHIKHIPEHWTPTSLLWLHVCETRLSSA